MTSLNRYHLSECPYYHVLGRTSKNRSPLTLFWTASGIEIRIQASELWVEFETDYTLSEQWISIYINDVQISRLMLPKGKQDLCIFRNMNPDKIKKVKIIKEVQAMPNDENALLQIHSLLTDGEFFPMEEKTMKLEVIGDSITSGEGSIGAKEEEDWIPMFFSASNTYSAMLAKELDADLHIISQSGWGVLCSWDNNPHSNIPDIYEKICGAAYGKRNLELGAQDNYDLSSWQPDIILINLGTNDGVAFEQPEWVDEKTGERFLQRVLEDNTFAPESITHFENAVTNFLYKLRKYNKNARIIWVYGMLGYVMRPYIQHAIDVYRKETNDTLVSYLDLPSCTPLQEGARHHPGIECHHLAAKTILEFLKQNK